MALPPTLAHRNEQLQPILAKSGEAVATAVAPVGPALQAWSAEHLEPLVKRGGEELQRALVPAQEQLQLLLAKIDPHYTSAVEKVKEAIKPAWDAIIELIEKIKPIVANAVVALKENSLKAQEALVEWNKTQLTPWALQTGQAIQVSSAAAWENAQVKSKEAAFAIGEWNETQLQPWAKQTGAVLQEHTLKTQAAVDEWNKSHFQPWVANTAVPQTQKWWRGAVVCFVAPLASVVAAAGLKDQAEKLQGIAKERAIDDSFTAAVCQPMAHAQPGVAALMYELGQQHRDDGHPLRALSHFLAATMLAP